MSCVCAICTSSLQSSVEIFSTLCGHVFHGPCLMQWLQRSETCPQCRDLTTMANIHRLYLSFLDDTAVVEDQAGLQKFVTTLEVALSLKEIQIQIMELHLNMLNEELKKLNKIFDTEED